MIFRFYFRWAAGILFRVAAGIHPDLMRNNALIKQHGKTIFAGYMQTVQHPGKGCFRRIIDQVIPEYGIPVKVRGIDEKAVLLLQAKGCALKEYILSLRKLLIFLRGKKADLPVSEPHIHLSGQDSCFILRPVEEPDFLRPFLLQKHKDTPGSSACTENNCLFPRKEALPVITLI